MTTISASEAKLHFGALVDKAQRAPVTIEKQGRPVAVVMSFDEYQEQFSASPSQTEKTEALAFFEKWSKQKPAKVDPKKLEGDIKAQAIWDKYMRD